MNKRLKIIFAAPAMMLWMGCTLETDSALRAEMGIFFGSSSGGSVDNASVTNVRDNGVIQSGVLRGTMPSSDNTVLISLDNGDFLPATSSGGSDWTYALPAGSDTWRLGSVHGITVRTADSSGNLADDVNLSVRKGVNHDVNGDGIPDLAAGAPLHSANRGQTFLFNGSATNIQGGTASNADFQVTGPNPSEEFGRTIAMGDVNGDGFADIIVGAEQFSTSTGNVYIFHGSAGGASTSPNTVITGAAASNFFGSTLTAADINGDGFDELIVGAWGHATSGRVYIFNGSASGITQTAAAGANRIITGGSAGDSFGFSVAAGDINGDGLADVAAGARDYTGGQGRVYVFNGNSAGVLQTGANAADTILTGDVAGDQLGTSVAIADINGDGFAELLSGAPNKNTATGTMYIHFGNAGGITTAQVSLNANTTISGETTGVVFGTILRAGDINGDGFAELMVSSHAYGGSSGRAYVFFGSDSGINATSALDAGVILTGENTGVEFSFAVSIADWNGDGFKDLAAGARKQNTDTGRVYILNGSQDGLVGPLSASNTTIDGVSTATQFGGGLF